VSDGPIADRDREITLRGQLGSGAIFAIGLCVAIAAAVGSSAARRMSGRIATFVERIAVLDTFSVPTLLATPV
jgi:hypothetical protein